jgi:hypothetical protein
MLNKTKIALAAALVIIGTASTALALPPVGDVYANPPCFDAAGRWYYPASAGDCHAYFPTASNAYGFVPSATHHKHHRSQH